MVIWFDSYKGHLRDLHVEPEPEQDDADPQATALTAFPSDLSSHHCAEHKAKLEKVNEFAGHHNVEIYVEKRDPKLKKNSLLCVTGAESSRHLEGKAITAQ